MKKDQVEVEYLASELEWFDQGWVIEDSTIVHQKIEQVVVHGSESFEKDGGLDHIHDTKSEHHQDSWSNEHQPQ